MKVLHEMSKFYAKANLSFHPTTMISLGILIFYRTNNQSNRNVLWYPVSLSPKAKLLSYFYLYGSHFFRTYWPDLDGKIREALVLRSVKVRLLISFWKKTDPLTFNFISSLKAICTEIANCSLKVVSITL